MADHPIDLKVLAELREAMGEGFGDVVDLFIRSTPELVGKLKAATAQRDAKLLFQTAHTLKSSSGNLGALGLSALCRELEALGRKGETLGCLELVARIELEYAAVQETLKRYNGSGGVE